MAKRKWRAFFVQRLTFALLAFGWAGASFLGWLDGLENLAMDWRFQLRGPVETRVPITYVNHDTYSSQRFGMAYFPRDAYAEVANALMEEGRAQAIFFDFIFSDITFRNIHAETQIVDLRNDTALASTLRRYPDRIVLAAAYTGTLEEGFSAQSDLPLKQLARDAPVGAFVYDPAQNPPPELPMYPFWMPAYTTAMGYEPGWGRIGLIDWRGVPRNTDAVLRWLPLFVEVHNDYPMRLTRQGMLTWWERHHHDAASPVVTPLDLGSEALYSVPEPAGGNRFLPASLDVTFFTAAIELLLTMNPGATAAIAPNAVEIRRDHDLLYRIPLTDGQVVEVNWLSHWTEEQPGKLGLYPENLPTGYHPAVSMAVVYEQYHRLLVARAEADAEATAELESWFDRFENRIILIGPTDPLIQDVGPTPFTSQNVPRVSAHGNFLETILTGRYLHRLAWRWELLIIIGLALIVTEISLLGGVKSRVNKVAALFLLFAYASLAFIGFREYDWVLPFIGPIGAALTTTLLGFFVQVIEEERQKRYVQNLFGTYVSPALVQQMIAADEPPRLGGHTEEITAFFSDIQGFSSFSEVLPPSDLVELMNTYLNAMTEILETEGGTLDKYIGDAIVGIFGAPVPVAQHALRGCVASLRMHQRQAELRAEWAASERWPELVHHMQTRIGLCTGEATVGNMGSFKRFNYTMMGDTVNIAARNESGAKSYGVYTMVAGETKAAAEAAGEDCLFRYLDKIVVKGRSQPLDVYEVVTFRRDVTPDLARCLATYDEAMDHYLAQRWTAARKAFLAAAADEIHQPDPVTGIQTNPSHVLAARCLAWQANPPGADWDGRFVMTTK